MRFLGGLRVRSGGGPGGGTPPPVTQIEKEATIQVLQDITAGTAISVTGNTGSLTSFSGDSFTLPATDSEFENDSASLFIYRNGVGQFKGVGKDVQRVTTTQLQFSIDLKVGDKINIRGE